MPRHSIAPRVEVAVDGHPHCDVERSGGRIAGVVGDAFDFHGDAVAVNAIGQRALEVGRTGQRLRACPCQEQGRQKPKQSPPQSDGSVHVNAPPPCPVAPPWIR